MDMHSPVNAEDGNFLSNLECTFSESLHIEDAQKSDLVSKEDDNCTMREGKGNLCEGFEEQETKLNMKCLKKCSTFPDMMLPRSSSDQKDDKSLADSLSDQSPCQSSSCSVSVLAPSTLVSAMKGSRVKQRASQLDLTVKWAPGVYDPAPTLLSHTVKGKKQHRSRHKSEKKYVKKGQKGYPSKGSSGKDKKHYHNRKSGETSDMWWLDSHHDRVIGASTELDDVNVVTHDSHCGTSFLKKSIEKVHYPVGEVR
ncbi:hypothetical protein TanjilG_18215 [Lupinus angustifolius]|uniref:Uncharacterized protein n=1 Tax=Lupinus angustifolius TaxID=3871 RepID=A0A1J7GMI6_LUPAN|nr:PREDICTED: uncharacterized protein LOC109360569 [Lupinus angustifolius]XP_019461094.1 PREDICTED: uncharacterized protein LOC109360569 [Lupinus angustifolius]XP_019461095.1 PREDICTED: uncharacterized protein LOC109360569 [Lupinus angustifolius]OIW01644.1 hypothetical protein TanjilG_18215 [Lupinus angustifolius]